MKIRDRIKELRRVPASEILPNPKNWRTHPKEQQDALRGVLSEVGIADALLVRETEHGLQLVDGHLRTDTAPDTEWPVLVLDVTEEEADKLLATFDPLASMAGMDADYLRSLVESVETSSEGLQAMLDKLLAEATAELTGNELDSVVQDEPPGLPKETKTQPGDIWQLGGHRLLCGDCRDLRAVEKLMDGELASACFTDPPYNVAYQGGTKEALTIQNDDMSGEDFLQFLRDVFASMHSVMKPGSAIYVCHADSEGLRFRQAFTDAGFNLRQCIIWVKNSLVLGRQDYQWRHEPILYGWKPGEAHRFYGDRKQTTVFEDDDVVEITEGDDRHFLTVVHGTNSLVISMVDYKIEHVSDGELDTTWRIDRPKKNAEHPTMKPVMLCARGVSHGSQPGEIVIDFFGGSGSTLIACEQLGRRCFTSELDPRYCDVIVERWESLTGQKATRIA